MAGLHPTSPTLGSKRHLTFSKLHTLQPDALHHKTALDLHSDEAGFVNVDVSARSTRHNALDGQVNN